MSVTSMELLALLFAVFIGTAISRFVFHLTRLIYLWTVFDDEKTTAFATHYDSDSPTIGYRDEKIPNLSSCKRDRCHSDDQANKERTVSETVIHMPRISSTLYPRHLPLLPPSPLIPRGEEKARAHVWGPATKVTKPGKRRFRRIASQIYPHSDNAAFDWCYYATVHHPRVVSLNPTARRMVMPLPEPTTVAVAINARKSAKMQGRPFFLPAPRTASSQ
ncbi:hypothetical protein CC1G_13820 [Coprinopsis cinerea okayama7|uniref:Uncharacterized protein n=1 Tax=Coprinopsis cinerea (strain Okayama-7 / 130 / ATCC MYA-4618 / FGSC 9003) TaxID=240176 RepID=D6RKE5_COPC7|nr:hypothetical protein CC1G_13820 [Coprinopsis cinerea okayama7\|eukprot:XP_002911785.1 hypothetical protein CC1G_13820 [Coprinopsis cinerea okayama7\